MTSCLSLLMDSTNTVHTSSSKITLHRQVAHSSLTPTRTISESIELVCVPVVNKCDSYYSVVQASLLKHPMYSPIFLNDFAPDDRHQRKNWVAGLKLEFPAMLYRSVHGNNLGTLTFVWKTTEGGGEATRNAKLVTELNQKQKLYSTREMQRDFIQRYYRLNKERPQSKAVLRNTYKFLTGDSSSSRSAAEKEVDEQVTKLAEEAFEMDEPEVLLDLRKLNGKPYSTVFDKFWEELSTYLEEVTPAVDDC